MTDLQLVPYSLVPEEAKRNLLLGNGFSQGLHGLFQYGSLQQRAEEAGLIGPEVRRLFERLGTSDFERVLSRLVEAKVINDAHGIASEPLEASRQATREALIQVVSLTHPERRRLDRERLGHYRRELRRFERIFTTNYDLLLYWIAGHRDAGGEGLEGFKDFFWNDESSFDLANTGLSLGPTHLYYLHGALFLQRKDGRVCKVKRDRASGNDLLTTLRKTLESAAPVFVSEGDAAAKRRSIAQNEYLEWAYRQLETLDEGITVFGHSLSEPDSHILEALCRGCSGPIAVGLYGEPSKQKQEAAGLIARSIRHHREDGIVFFDAATFPLVEVKSAN